MIAEHLYEEKRLTGMPIEELDALNQSFEQATPKQIVEWAWASYGPKAVISSSFQTQSVPLLHIISETAPEMTVLFIDTGFHFPETLAFRDRISSEFNLNTKIIQPQIHGQDFLDIYGSLYQDNPDLCCFLNKVAPIQHELQHYRAWLSGIRRDQTAYRENSQIVGKHPFLPLVKINPVAMWNEADVDQYIELHSLPRHPLWEAGYRSIGCGPCTAPVSQLAPVREGRWPGSTKDECGIHFYQP